MPDPNPWYHDAIFYELYIRAFRDSNADGHGDLPGVIDRLDHVKDLGIDCIWLLPMYPSPLKDDGYDVADYLDIHPQYGTMQDFKRLIDEAHMRGLRVIADLVINHTSDEHPWFIESRSSRRNPKRDWYVWSDTKDRYSETRVIFIDTQDSNWTYDEKTGQYYWHRFFASQPDLNFDNPQVREAILDSLRFWLDKGIDGFRVDAVPYLFERDGTINENLPETHAFLKELRSATERDYPGALLLCEANQPPQDVIAYLGNGDEFHMAFHFPVMPRLYMALRSGDATRLRSIIEATPPIPEGTQWCGFLRNHDELTLEMVSEEERQWMWQEYAPEPAMRLNLGIRRRLAPLLENNLSKIKLANCVMFTLPGAPIIYYGDEIGMGDNTALFDRNGLRTPMQWDDTTNAGFSDAPPESLYLPVIDDPEFGYQTCNVAVQRADPDSLLNWMRRTIRIRKQHPAFARGTLEFIDTPDPALLAFIREYETETIVVIHNFGAGSNRVALPLGRYAGEVPVDLLTLEQPYPTIGEEAYQVDLGPYQSIWLRLAPG